jgi:DNA-binding transcriptional regulator YdaS (Cro superfamily)
MKNDQAARALAIRRAASMVGGLEALAERLKLSERQLDYWMRDIGTLPDTVFFDVIDIIIERAGKRTAERPLASPAAYKTAA